MALLEGFTGRDREKELLEGFFDSDKAEFLAIYGP